MPSTSLVAKVSDLLAARDNAQAKAFDQNYKSAGTDEDDLVELNRYFRQRLSNAPCATLDERECLRDDLHPSTWIKYFESHVLPTLVRFKLITG